MRESLTVLAIALIVVLTTALVGPYVVDWNAHRSEIEARLSALLGTRVTVAGPVDVKLLPRPIFRLSGVTVGGDTPDAVEVRARRADMELSLTALLRGELSFVDATLTAPVVTVPRGRDGTVRLPPVGPAEAGRVELVHLALRNGTLVLRGGPGQPEVALSGLSGSLQAESLLGPFKFDGAADTARGRLGLRIATGTADHGRLRLKANLDPGGPVPRTEFDGVVTATAAGGSGAALAFDGTVTAAGALPLPAHDGAEVPWHLAGRLHAGDGMAELTEGELRAGPEGRALVAALSGRVTGGPRPAAQATLRGRQLDLTRLATRDTAANGTDATTAGADVAALPLGLPDLLAAVGAMGRNGELAGALPLPVTVDAQVDTVAAGTLQLAATGGTVTAAAGQPLVGRVAATLPDGSSASLDGRFEPGPAGVFKGQVTLDTPHLPRIADALAPELPETAAALRQALPVEVFRARGTLDLSGVGFAARDLALTLDRSTLSGTVTLTRGVGAERPRLFADLGSDGLDLQALPAWRQAANAASGFDVSLKLAARALRLATGDTGGVATGRIAVQLNKAGPVVTLDRLLVADLGGATAEMRGRADGAGAHLDGRVDASRLRDLLGVVDRVMPGALADGLLARADALSPALLSVAAEAATAADGTLVPTLLTVNGTAGATRVAVRLRPEESATAAREAVPPFGLDATLEAPDAPALLRQLGFATTGAGAVGAGRITAKASRDARGLASGTVAVTLGDTALTLDGQGDAEGHGSATVTVRGANVAPLARVLALATPEPGAVWPLDARGTVSRAGARISTEGFGGTVIGTAFQARLAYAGDAAGTEDDPTLTGSVTVGRLPVPVLAGLVLGPLPPPRAGALWPDAPFGVATVNLPRAALALTATSLPLWGGLVAGNATTTLRTGPGSLKVSDLHALLGPDGHIGATLVLRRDGASASLAGGIDWSTVGVASTSLGGLSAGRLDLAGTGASVAALMASLAGSGTLELTDGRLPRLDPGALPRAIAVGDAAATTVDEGAITAAIGRELDRAAFPLGGHLSMPVTVAAGAVRVAPVTVASGPATAEVSGTLDLGTLLLSLRTVARDTAPPRDWVGAPPQVTVNWRGPFASPAREVDAATLVNGVAARSIARDQARIELFQEDVRERAFFAARLRRIEADQQAARDKANAEADRQRLQQMIQGGASSPPRATAAEATPGPVPPRRPAPTPSR